MLLLARATSGLPPTTRISNLKGHSTANDQNRTRGGAPSCPKRTAAPGVRCPSGRTEHAGTATSRHELPQFVVRVGAPCAKLVRLSPVFTDLNVHGATSGRLRPAQRLVARFASGSSQASAVPSRRVKGIIDEKQKILGILTRFLARFSIGEVGGDGVPTQNRCSVGHVNKGAAHRATFVFDRHDGRVVVRALRASGEPQNLLDEVAGQLGDVTSGQRNGLVHVNHPARHRAELAQPLSATTKFQGTSSRHEATTVDRIWQMTGAAPWYAILKIGKDRRSFPQQTGASWQTHSALAAEKSKSFRESLVNSRQPPSQKNYSFPKVLCGNNSNGCTPNSMSTAELD